MAKNDKTSNNSESKLKLNEEQKTFPKNNFPNFGPVQDSPESTNLLRKDLLG